MKEIWVIYRIDNCGRRHYCRTKPRQMQDQKNRISVGGERICGNWSHNPDRAWIFDTMAEAEKAAGDLGFWTSRPGTMHVTTRAEAVERANKGWTRRNNRSTVRAGG